MTAPIDRACVVMGVPVDDVTLSEAVDRIAMMVARGRSSGRVHQVATVNVDFVVNAATDDPLLAVLQRTDMSIPDGMPLIWASRVLGSPLRTRTTGIDLVPALAERAAADGHRIVFFGGAPGVADRAAEVVRERFPGLAITAVPAPTVGRDGAMAPEVLLALREARPDIVCVALGNPKQEHWIARYGASVGAPVYIGIGGSLDFLTGITRRAPVWMQRAGLEWLHRAASEPRRLALRYARDFRVFVPGVVRQARRGPRRAPAIAPMVELGADGALVLRLLGPVPLATLEADVVARVRDGADLIVDMSAAGPPDNLTLSTLVGLIRTARRTGARITVVSRVTPASYDRRAGAMGALLHGAYGELSIDVPSILPPCGG